MNFFDDSYIPGDNEVTVDTAQICLNGHVINASYHFFPQANTEFCAECGQPTMIACKNCDAEIRGEYSNVFGGYKSPKYCHRCGKAYPWTETRLEAAKELTEEAENLSHEEKEQLKNTFDDLVKETPRTPIAVSRYKKLTQKAGSFVADAMQKILTDVFVLYVKKELHLP